MHHSAFWFCFREYSQGLIQCFSYRIKLSHRYNTRANCKKKMEGLKQEIRELREEVVTLKAGMEHLTTLVEALVAAQVNPSMMEERMAKVFLETLNSSFPEGIVVRTPTDSHGEVDMNALLEKDVRKDCLFEEVTQLVV